MHTKNKTEKIERNKIKYIEERITALEKAIERLNKNVSSWKLGEKWITHE